MKKFFKRTRRLVGILLALCLSAALLSGITLADTAEDLIVNEGETLTITENMTVGEVVLDGTVTADYPVIVFFESSDDVENGDVINNVQFVSEYDEVVAIVHTNDVHGELDIEPYVKGLADELKASELYSLVLTVSAGDVYAGGKAVAGSYNGEFIPAVVDMVYDVIVPGNNDYGLNDAANQHILLTALYSNTITLCANYYAGSAGLQISDYAASYGDAWIGNELFAELYEKISLNDDGTIDWSGLNLEDYDCEAGESPYQATTTFTTSEGTVIGLFGLSTDGGAASTLLDSTGSIAAAESSIETLQEEGATVIVGIGHTGWPDGDDTLTSTSSNDTNSAQIALQTTGIDAFVDGHTHSIINDGEGWMGGESNTIVNQASSFGACIGLMTLYINDGVVVAKDAELIDDYEDTITPDEDVKALTDEFQAIAAADLGDVLATTEYFLNGERMSASNEGGTVRGNETNLGDLMTDIVRAALSEQLGYELDFAVIPGYWLRSSIEAGDITLEDIQSVFANPTVLQLVEYTADEIVDMVESGLSTVYPEGEDTTFNQYSGITVVYTDNNGTGTPITIYVGDTLIYDVENGGVQVDSSWTASGVYTLTGGEIDAWTGSTESWLCSDKTEVQELVADYLSTHEQGVDYVIYPNTVAPAGRIVDASTIEETDDAENDAGAGDDIDTDDDADADADTDTGDDMNIGDDADAGEDAGSGDDTGGSTDDTENEDTSGDVENGSENTGDSEESPEDNGQTLPDIPDEEDDSQTEEDTQSEEDTQTEEDTQSGEDTQTEEDTQSGEDTQTEENTQSGEDTQTEEDTQSGDDSLVQDDVQSEDDLSQGGSSDEGEGETADDEEQAAPDEDAQTGESGEDTASGDSGSADVQGSDSDVQTQDEDDASAQDGETSQDDASAQDGGTSQDDASAQDGGTSQDDASAQDTGSGSTADTDTEEETETESETDTGSDAAEVGDVSGLMLWIILAAAAVLGLAYVSVKKAFR